MSYDLWGDEGEAAKHKIVKTKTIAPGWDVKVEVLPSAGKDAARRRKYQPEAPNKRAAIPLPVAGQSYNPTDAAHQEAVAAAVAQLSKKQKAHDKFVKELNYRGEKEDGKYLGNLSSDKLWEEEVAEKKPTKRGPKTPEEEKRRAKQSQRDTKKHLKAKRAGAVKKGRRPNRDKAVRDIDSVEQLAAAALEKAQAQEVKGARKKAARAEGQLVPKYGRHHHQPLALDVLPSDQLVGSLRHLKGGTVPSALAKIKSLEERGLVPARMRHTYNKRHVYKAKGEVHIVKESAGRGDVPKGPVAGNIRSKNKKKKK